MNAYATPPGSDGDGSLPPSPSVVMSGYGGPYEEGGGAGQEPVYKFEGPIPQSYFDLSEEDIATIPYRDLVKLMSKSGLTDREVEVAKKLRRKVKNRLSARVCTGRKRVYEARSSNDTATLVSKVTHLTASNNHAMLMVQQLQASNSALVKSQARAQREMLFFEAETLRMRALVEAITGSDEVWKLGLSERRQALCPNDPYIPNHP